MPKKLVALFTALFLMLLLPTAALAEDSLCENGDFETVGQDSTLPAGWYYEAWVLGEETGLAEITPNGNGNAVYLWCGEEGNDVRLCQKVTVKANSFYRLTCRVKTKSIGDGAGANISVVGSLASSQGIYGTTDWTTLELVGKTAKGQKEIIVCVRIGGYGALSSGSAWFDDVSVQQIDNFSGDAADFSSADSGSTARSASAADGEVPYTGKIMLALLSCAFLSLLVYRAFIEREQLAINTRRMKDGAWLLILLILGFAFRVILSLLYYGHSTDINCFMAWSYHLAEGGLSSFYTSGMFADYPPGYMYVLWLTGSIGKLFGLEYGGAGYVLITKMPGILADLASAYVIYRIADKALKRSETAEPRATGMPLVLAGFVALNPLLAFLSGGWGQIDQILSLLLFTVIWLFLEDKTILAGVVFGIAIMVKPQALMVGPLLAIAYFCRIKDKGWKKLPKTVAAVAGAVAALFVLSLPFQGGQQPLWFLNKILGTATSYNYASIEAFNLMGLLGGNWVSADDTLFLLTYGQLGTILMILAVLFSCMMYIDGRKREKNCLLLCGAYVLIALFNLGHFMHERYLVPALFLLLAAFVYYRDKRLMVSFLWVCCAALFNVLFAFVITDHQDCRGAMYNAFIAFGSLMNLGAFGYLTYTCVDMIYRKQKRPAFADKRLPKQEIISLPEPVDNKLHYSKKDKLFVLAVTLVYGVVALVNLGTTTAPETVWKGAAGDQVTITLERQAEIAEIRVFGGLYTGTITLTADDGTEITYTEDNGDMFRWKNIGGGMTTSSFSLKVDSGTVWFNEIAFFDQAGNYIPASAGEVAAALFDEPEEVPQTPSYLYGMYFDELYHARTAYEHLHGIQPYENSHPPLGKILIMLGIAVFGMNTLGWRIVGALFGVVMVPIVYAFGKRLFKKSEYALLAAVLFAFDFMHFTQTRIATIDVYGVFFILLMYYYMYQYYTMNFFADGLKKTLKPLALAGVFFALGAASKWICIYAGGGLAVILFTSLGKRFAEYRKLKDSEDEALRTAVKPFVGNTIKTLLWCCLFFIAVPVGVYLLSYLPYVLSESHYDLAGIWGVQEFMFSYHSGLTATHPYQSPWWQWPLILRPMWYYVSYDVPDGMIGTLSAMGNPAVWWVCLVGTVAAIIKLVRGKLKMEPAWFVLLVGLGANYLPWVLVSRCTFIYHYFASVPFILLMTVLLLKKKEDCNPRWGKVIWIWMSVALLLFALFYPVISGMPCSKAYVQLLEWLPSWTFLGY